MTARQMTFANEYVDAILAGEKTATVRVGWDDLTSNDYLLLVDGDGEQFARGDIDSLARVPVRKALDAVSIMDAEHTATSTAALLRTLNRHYDRDVSPVTEVLVVRFDVRQAERPVQREVRRR